MPGRSATTAQAGTPITTLPAQLVPTALPQTGLFEDVVGGGTGGIGVLALSVIGLVGVIVVSRRLRNAGARRADRRNFRAITTEQREAGLKAEPALLYPGITRDTDVLMTISEESYLTPFRCAQPSPRRGEGIKGEVIMNRFIMREDSVRGIQRMATEPPAPVDRDDPRYRRAARCWRRSWASTGATCRRSRCSNTCAKIEIGRQAGGGQMRHE
ncbi:MAG: hypothetical protein U0703_07280 [Anaerolineae bacterium]